MVKIAVVSSVPVAKKVVQQILTYGEDHIAVSVKHQEISQKGGIVLVTLGSADGHRIHVFDIKSCPDIMQEGQLWRILQAPALCKVMHDCRQVSAILKQQFGITLHNVFDTQAAYCLLMMENKLPPRMIHINHLYEKFGDPEQRLMDLIQESQKFDSGLVWSQRPMSNAMVRAASVHVRLLLPSIYNNINRELPEDAEPFMTELCKAYINGKFSGPSTTCTKSNSGTKSQRKVRDTVIRLTDEQKHLLTNTLPQASVAPAK